MKVLIIGNGFDLDLGLKTKYSDFAKSEEWTDLFQNNRCDNNLADYLFKHSKTEEWFDIEKCIRDYVQGKESKRDYDNNIVFPDKWFLDDLERKFDKYLSSELIFRTPLNKNSLAAQLIAENKANSCFDSIYSFNFVEYNILNEIANGNVESLDNVQYVHGFGSNLIFGIDEEGCSGNHYSFTKKVMHPNYPSTNIIPDLEKANEVVIFGHSINSIDWKYFQMFFENSCKYSNGLHKHITIITKDDDSKKRLKENLNNFGISITLLSSISHLEFIETVSYYKGEYETRDKVGELLTRIRIQ